MADPKQEVKTRQLAVSQVPELKRQCGKCPFAKEYNLVERQFVLVDKQGKAHTLNGYVREKGYWLDGMLSILKQNGAVAEKIYLPGCGWGISPAVLKDGTVIQNPHGYFDGNLPVAMVNGEKTELNFANIRIDNQSVVVKDEEPKCPFGKSLVNTEGLVFGKGEYGELDPNSRMISWGMTNPFGAPVRPLIERAPSYLLPQIGPVLGDLHSQIIFPQNPLVGAQRYDAVAFRQMEERETAPAYAQEVLVYAAPAIIPASLAQEIVMQPSARTEEVSLQEIRVEKIEIVETRKEPERRKEEKPVWEKMVVLEAKPAVRSELPAQEARKEISFGEKPAWKPEAPKGERKREEKRLEETKETTEKSAGKKTEPPPQRNVKGASIAIDVPMPAMQGIGARNTEKRAGFSNWKDVLPEITKRPGRKRLARMDEKEKECRKEAAAPRNLKKRGKRIFSEKIPLRERLEIPRQRKEKEQKVHFDTEKEGPAGRVKRRKERKMVSEEFRANKIRQEKKVKEKRASEADGRKKRSNYAEKYLLRGKARKRKRGSWLAISRR